MCLIPQNLICQIRVRNVHFHLDLNLIQLLGLVQIGRRLGKYKLHAHFDNINYVSDLCLCLFFTYYFRWFRHITEASNAYKQRGRGDPITSRPNGIDEPHHPTRGKHDEGVHTLDVPGSGDGIGEKKGQQAGRSHSFHEQSTSSREPHPERQPSSPPEDRAQSETESLQTKAGKCRETSIQIIN